jgi:NADP-dependent 3-hydroxy acid dehydrogenase YdfG
VALLARRQPALDEIVARIRAAGGQALAIAADVTDAQALAAAAETVRGTFGVIDLVVNNAGVMLPGAVGQQPADEWQRQIDLNVTGAMKAIEAFLPQLEEAAAAGRTVDLINMSSIVAQSVFPYFAVYSATKAFVSHLTRHLRVELAPKDIRVSMIEPGIVATELQGHVTFQGAKDWLADAAGKMEFLQPADVAGVVAFIAAQPRHVNLQQVVVMPSRMT